MGINVNDVYQSSSNRLKAADLDKREWLLTIKEVKLAKFRQDDGYEKQLLELFFNETEKTFPLNKTNAGTIEYVHGGDTDAWLGKQIVLFPTMVSFGDKMVEAIRVRVQMAQGGPTAPPAAPTPAPAAPPSDGPGPDDYEDSIPF